MDRQLTRWQRHGSTDSEPDTPTNGTRIAAYSYFAPNSTIPQPTSPSLYDLILDPQTSATLNLLFTYIFTFLVLTFLHRNFHRFIFSRQNFALHLIHSISARTVLVTNLPNHLRGDRALAEYFDGCGWPVESVSVCRSVEPLKRLLEKRTLALLGLESAWTEWVGNPATKEIKNYDPNVYTTKPNGNLTASPEPAEEPLIPGLDDPSATPTPSASGTSSSHDVEQDLENGEFRQQIHTSRPRPTFRPRWFGSKVDAVDYWEKKFKKADEGVREMRKRGRFDASHVAFVTFEDVKDAQTACQVVHYPHHSEVITEPAPEPRDVVWSKISMSIREAQFRDIVVMGVMVVLLLSWIAPVSTLATLLSYEEIKKLAPWLARVIDASPRLGALIQNTLPSLALIIFNGFLPFLLEWLSYEQGFKSRSATEYSLMKKYYLFLLISVLFIFLLTSSYWALVRDLADTPMKIPEKLANALQGSNAKNFMVSYVMLQGIGMMPFQLLCFGPLLSLGFTRIFTRTPRDFAEAYAPPMLNYGWVYPQAMLIFTVTLVYSVVSPLILVFGAIYFGNAYIVYKYKLLFIYYKPYESNGEAWRITFSRLLWGLILLQLFMTGLFSLQQSYWLSLAMVPLILYTLWWSWVLFKDFGPLSEYLALSSICEVQRGEGADSVVGVRDEDSVTRSQSNLNHRRYAVNDETLYVAPSDKRTDYSQPPMNNFYYGVLNTGRRRYAHPALSGILPNPWLPNKERLKAFGDNAPQRRSVVLSLRRKMVKRFRGKNQIAEDEEGENVGENGEENGESSNLPIPDDWSTGGNLNRNGTRSRNSLSTASNPWRDSSPTPSPHQSVQKKISFDPASGIIALPEENVWDDVSDNEGDSGEPAESPSTYYHRPDRRRSHSGSEALASSR
ncbi:calcium permeable stress-gated cation channel, partial [Tremellales sp. Uapishka_1]